MSSTATHPPLPGPSAGEPPLWPITVPMYAEMIRAGILKEHDRVYLWRGRLAPLMPIGRLHSATVRTCYDALLRMLPDGYDVDREQPMALLREPSAPQPDLVVIRGRVVDRLDDLLTSADVLLLVEVAHTSLTDDRRLAGVYAAEGIPAYWIINVPERRLEVHTEPAGNAYGRRTVYGPEEEVAILLDGHEVGRIVVSELFALV